MKKRILTQVSGINSEGEPYNIAHEDEFKVESEQEKITLQQLLDANFPLMSMPIDNGDTVSFRVEFFK